MRAASTMTSMTPEQDQAWRDMVALGQEIQGADCWAWWEDAGEHGHHRCTLRDGHQESCRCCCDATAADARDKIRARMTAGECIVPREALDRMARDGQAAGLYEATEGEPPRMR